MEMGFISKAASSNTGLVLCGAQTMKTVLNGTGGSFKINNYD